MQPQFVKIKTQLVSAIEQGNLKPGDKIASENQLAMDFGVSRMTARQALSELVAEGILARSQGIGTFVSDERPMSSMLTIVGIKQEIEQRHHHYKVQVLKHEARCADNVTAGYLGYAASHQLFYSQLVHLENGLPVQLETRWVNPGIATDFLQQDLTQVSINSYLHRVAPLTEADHIVEAIPADAHTAHWLDITTGEACLCIHRRTYCSRGIVSVATLTHPGSRYRLGSHLQFTATDKGQL